MRLSRLLEVIRTLAPEHLAADWDKVGLHVGDPRQRVRAGLLCIDPTSAVMAEAVRRRVGLIVAYHPPIFTPLSRLVVGDPKQEVIRQAVRHDIALYSPHTALDAAAGGINDWLASGIGRGVVKPIEPAKPQAACKVVTFVPHRDADRLRDALSSAGAGVIGDYTRCSFGVSGEGTFFGGAGTQPKVGRSGRLERVAELRLEMVCAQAALAGVIAALRATHPYEEPAFDVYRLESPADTTVGQGKIVTLAKPVTLAALVRRVRQHLKVRRVDVARPQAAGGLIRRVGLCAGSGGSLLEHAGEIDAFLTGEMRHHEVLAAAQRGITVLLAGHTQTERPYLPVYRRKLAQLTGLKVRWFLSREDRPPLRLS